MQSTTIIIQKKPGLTFARLTLPITPTLKVLTLNKKLETEPQDNPRRKTSEKFVYQLRSSCTFCTSSSTTKYAMYL